MKRCTACHSRAYLADVHCQRCGAAIVPPPPVWLRRVGMAFWALCLLAVPFQLYRGARSVLETESGRAGLVMFGKVGRYVVANGSDIAGIALAFVVVPLVALYVALRAIVDLGDWLDLKTQQWRAERFRRYGW